MLLVSKRSDIEQLLELLMREKSNKLGSNLNLEIYFDLEESLGAQLLEVNA